MTTTARCFAWRSSLIALSLLANGCELWNDLLGKDQAATEGPQQAPPGGGECTKDPEEIRSVMLSPPECDTATPCPCGTICSDELGGHCTADCIDDSWCAPGHVCSDFGQCLDEDDPGNGDPDVNPTCPRNETLLDEIEETPRACRFDDECPFGSYCHRGEGVCRYSCRDDADCESQGDDFVCTCLGKCAEPSDLRGKPEGELPSLELDTNAFYLSRPADILNPDWGDVGSRDVVLTLKTATVSDALIGPQATVWVTPDENTLVKCSSSAELSEAPCSVELGVEPYTQLEVQDGFESQAALVTFAPREGAEHENVDVWEVKISSIDARGPAQTVRAWYGAESPEITTQYIYPGYLGADFRGFGTASIQTPTGATLNLPVEARVLVDPEIHGTVFALYDSSLTLSPTGTLLLGNGWDYAWLDSAVDQSLDGVVRGKLAGWPQLISMELANDGTITGTANLSIVIPTPDTVFSGSVSGDAYRTDTKLAFAIQSDPNGAPHACQTDGDCAGATCGGGFCGGFVEALNYGLPVEIPHAQRDVWTVNRDLGMTQANIEGFPFVSQYTNPFLGGVRQGFFEPGRLSRKFGTSGDFDAWYFIPGGAGTFDAAHLGAVPMLRVTEDAPHQTSSSLLAGCLSDLSRTPTSPTIPSFATDAWRTDFEYHPTWLSCINLGRFFFGLRDRAIYQRLIQQWLEVHSFIAREGAEELKLSKVASLIEEPAAANAVSADELMTTVENGLLFVLSELGTAGLDGERNALLSKLTPEELSLPDYRVAIDPPDNFPSGCSTSRPCPPELECRTFTSGRTNCVARTLTAAPHFEQPVGIPSLLLETAANYVKLAGVVLDETARSVYGTDGDQTARRRALAGYGRAVRLAIAVELLAKTYRARTPCVDANCDAVGRRFEAASDEYQVAVARAEISAQALRGGYDIYGIPADEVALFFGDPVGTNSRYFAASDYLLNGYAEPAVVSAQGALAEARQAWLSKRDSTVQEQLNVRNHLNEVDGIKSKYGSVILENCGEIETLDTRRQLESVEVLDYFKEKALDNSTCFITNSCLNESDIDALERSFVGAFLLGAGYKLEEGTSAELTQGNPNLPRTLASRTAQQQACAVSSMDPAITRNTDLEKYAAFARKVGYVCMNNHRNGTNPDLAHQCAAWKADDGHFYFGRQFQSNVLMPLAAFYRPIKRTEIGPNGTFRAINPSDSSTIDGQFVAWLLSGPDDNVYNFYDYAAADQIWIYGPTSVASQYRFAAEACRNGRNGHLNKEYPLPGPSELPPECYKGALGIAFHEAEAAKSGLERAQVVLDNGKDQIVDQYKLCSRIDSNRETLESMEREVEFMRRDYELVSSLVSGISSMGKLIGGDYSGGIEGLIGFGMDAWEDVIEEEQRKVERLEKHFSREEKSMECWNTWRDQRRQLRTAMLDIKIGFATMSKHVVAYRNLASQNDLALQEGLSALERDASRPIGSLAHHYWVDEKVERFGKQLEWARRVTLLALNAVEYEFQQSLPYRSEIAQAVHPNQLEDVVMGLKAEQASRTINRRRPEESAIVVSLRDDVMSVMDRTDAEAGERNWDSAQRFASRLWDERYSVRSNAGDWLGQGIPFTLGPTDVLETRCGERMWRVTATIQGDGLGVDAPNASVLLLKRNTFSSQFCDGKGEGMQTGAIRPSAELFQPGSEVDLSEADQMTGALITPWFNVTRSEFYRESYQEGSSEEHAGRGLYGDYVLLFPKQLLDEGFALERVEDVLLRIDYLSVDNLEN